MTSKYSTGDAWKLAEPHAGEAQGIVVSGYAHLPVTQTLLLHFDWESGARGGVWLKALENVAPVTAADGKQDTSVALGITATGLRKMGLAEEVLEGFSTPFLEGMFQVDRMRRLNDRVGSEWSGCVLEGGPIWSANTPVPEICDASQQLAALPKRDPTVVTTPITVHAILILHTQEADDAASWAKRVAAELAKCGVSVVRQKETTLGFDENGMVREHFGFVDGLSQPTPWDAKAVKNAGPKPDRVNGTALGDFLLGHVDGHHETTKGPLVAGPGGGLADPDDPDNLDLLHNGTYLVMRELRQDVAGFWNGAKSAAESLGTDPQTGEAFESDWIAERIIGRAMTGDVLRPHGVAPRKDPALPDNEFTYWDDDRVGLGCPLGSHIRRGNPRDGLATKPSQTKSLLASSNRHRIIRRARKFGPYIKDRMVDDGVERGLMFGVINADIERQYEFVQQIWMMSPSFKTLFGETDPLIGPDTPLTIGAEPVRRRVTIQNYTKLAGGEYFFVPSLPAIKWLSGL